jgi:lysophospholipase L1-like esterase
MTTPHQQAPDPVDETPHRSRNHAQFRNALGKKLSLRKERRLGTALAALALGLAAGELIARLDDRLFTDVPVLASPDREADLMLRGPSGIRGKPHGVYRKWKLNNFGFLGPDMLEAPAGHRVMVLGASETFGLYESRGHDYPSLLRQELNRDGKGHIEIVNAAIAGMALPTMTQFWDAWASRFDPTIVVIYPSPQFYLDIEPPAARLKSFVPEAIPEPGVQSRLAERIKDSVKVWPVLREIRARFIVSGALKGKDDAYIFTASPPKARLEAFAQDLERLCDAIANRGAVPVLVTHAFKTPSPPAVRDLPELRYYRIFFPRATPESMPAFDAAAQTATIELARRRGWHVIDAASSLNGRRALFADPVHFNDAGSLQMASILATALPEIIASTPARR